MEEHFATLNLLDRNSEQKLHRTISFSEFPCSRRLFMQQYYQTDQPNLIRQYSCEQIFHKDSNIRQVKVSELIRTDDKKHKKIWTKSYGDTPLPISWNSCGISNITNSQTLSYQPVEPMDVENTESKELNTDSNNSIKTTWPVSNENCLERSSIINDISQAKKELNSTNKLDYQEVKKKYRSLIPSASMQTKTSSIFCCHKTIFFVLLSILIFLIAVLLQQELSDKKICNHAEDFSNASIELHTKIYGQDETILSLSEYLEKDKSCFRIAILMGGTGVGKSYTVDIIRRNFPRQNLIFQYMPPLKFVTKFTELSLHHCNLVILENLRKEDTSDFITFWKTILKEKICVTLLAVFHVEEVTNNDKNRVTNLNQKVEELKISLKEENLIPTVFTYTPLNEEALEKCIKEAMANSQMDLTEKQIYDIKRMLLMANSGCKGAYAKVQIFGEV